MDQNDPELPPAEAPEPPPETAEIEIPVGDHLDDQLAGLVVRSRQYLQVWNAGLTLLVVCLVGAVVYLLVAQQNATQQNADQIAANQASSDHRWCAAFDLLTSVPVTPPPNPASNPSREGQYKLYADFVTLREQFRC